MAQIVEPEWHESVRLFLDLRHYWREKRSVLKKRPSTDYAVVLKVEKSKNGAVEKAFFHCSIFANFFTQKNKGYVFY